MHRTLILTVDMTGAPEWSIRAMQQQMSDWITVNKAILPIENLIILPTPGETKLYWLEGDPIKSEDKKTLDDIKDRLKPVLEVALDIKIDKDGLFKRPKEKINQAIKELNEIRQSAPEKRPKLHLP